MRRTCAIRQGQAVLIPLINGECSEIEGTGSTTAELRACAAAQADAFTELHARIDGRSIERLSRFRFESPPFRFESVRFRFGVSAPAFDFETRAVYRIRVLGHGA